MNNLLENEFSEVSHETPNSQAIESLESFFLKTKSNLNQVNMLNSTNGPLNENIIKIFESINQDISFLSELDSSLSVACEIMKQFMDCFLIAKKLAAKKNLKEKSDYHRLIQIEDALLTSIKLIVLYKGYSSKEKIILLKMYFYLRAMYLKEFFLKRTSLNTNNSFNFNLNSYLVT